MVGKLNLDLGDDYAFDIRRAREVAEGAGAGGQSPNPINDGVYGPYTTGGATWWIQKQRGKCYVWFDVDPDPEPDVRQEACGFIADTNNDLFLRNEVFARMEQLGCNCP